ncbi:MAG TPA: hypothetical protein VNN07_03815 [Candidatus Tectomicrobia bacterium]|nr:hypothetical protein [Candidatus Tectomicrobia bacterium]
MRRVGIPLAGVLGVVLVAAAMISGASAPVSSAQPATPPHARLSGFDRVILDNVLRQIEEGRRIFRFETFGDEAFWGDQLQLHRAVAGARLGGVGPGLSPAAALSLGLKVDVEALPADLVQALRRGDVDLDDPATTIALLRLDAVVGLTGFFDGQSLRSIGIQCALCHSTVDDSFAPGIGRRLDGWANRDLDVGAITALAPNLSPVIALLRIAVPGIDDATVRSILRSWGPGKFDAALLLDGKAVNPVTGGPAATLIPPAFGLAGVNLHTWTGWGSVTHWNAFVANLEMHGQGTFFDPRLDDPAKFPIAAAAGFGNVRNAPDLITGKLSALHVYQLAIPAPAPPPGSFDAAAAARGAALFTGKAGCARCHVPPLFTEPGWNLHAPAEVGIEDFQASRSPDERYRTSPLKGLWTHEKGGFYHDGRFATLQEVIDHYSAVLGFSLSAQETADLVEYLGSL